MPRQACQCGATYRFADSSIGKRAKCKSCGAVFTLQADDEGVIPIANEADERTGSADADAGTDTDRGGDDEEYRRAIGAGRARSSAAEDELPQRRGYFADCLALFTFPKDPECLITFLFLWGMLCVSSVLLSAVAPFGFFLQAIILGWYCAFRFAVIRESLTGDRGLPKLTLADGLWAEIVTPLLKWLGCWLLVLLPAVIGLQAVVGGGGSAVQVLQTVLNRGIGGIVQAGIVAEALVFVSLLGMGLFMWPIIILCVAVDGFGSLARVDLLFITVARTLPVYLLTAMFVFGADYVESYLAGLGHGFLWGALTVGAGLYLEIVALRMIGLYYYHFKKRFAWSW